MPLWFKKEALIEAYADNFQSTMRLTAEMIPSVMESSAVPNAPQGKAARAARLTAPDTALLSYGGLRGWVMQCRLPVELRARFLATVDHRLVEGRVFPGASLDALAFQEFWHASAMRATGHGKSIWLGVAESFLERLGAGGLHGEDAFRALPIAHALAGLARIHDQDLANFQKRFRLV